MTFLWNRYKTKDDDAQEKKKKKVIIWPQKPLSDDDEGWEKGGPDIGKSQEVIFQKKLRQLFPKDVDINEKSVLKKRNEIFDNHSKMVSIYLWSAVLMLVMMTQSADRQEQINQLQLLHQIVVQPKWWIQ